MYEKLPLLVVLILISFNAFCDDISITIKPSNGIVGTTSVTFHEDGKVTLLVYESAVQITEKLLDIGTEEARKLQNLAILTLDEYLNETDLKTRSEYTVTFGVSRTRDAITRSISSRRLTGNAIEIIDKIRKYTPNNDLVNGGG